MSWKRAFHRGTGSGLRLVSTTERQVPPARERLPIPCQQVAWEHAAAQEALHAARGLVVGVLLAGVDGLLLTSLIWWVRWA